MMTGLSMQPSILAMKISSHLVMWIINVFRYIQPNVEYKTDNSTRSALSQHLFVMNLLQTAQSLRSAYRRVHQSHRRAWMLYYVTENV